MVYNTGKNEQLECEMSISQPMGCMWPGTALTVALPHAIIAAGLPHQAAQPDPGCTSLQQPYTDVQLTLTGLKRGHMESAVQC